MHLLRFQRSLAVPRSSNWPLQVPVCFRSGRCCHKMGCWWDGDRALVKGSTEQQTLAETAARTHQTASPGVRSPAEPPHTVPLRDTDLPGATRMRGTIRMSLLPLHTRGASQVQQVLLLTGLREGNSDQGTQPGLSSKPAHVGHCRRKAKSKRK